MRLLRASRTGRCSRSFATARSKNVNTSRLSGPTHNDWAVQARSNYALRLHIREHYAVAPSDLVL
jgi:hypothetical protein